MALTLKNNDTNDLNTKKNHWRQRAMQLLHALDLEKMMGLRMKNMAKAYIPTKEGKAIEILPNAKTPEEAIAETPEMNHLNDFLVFLRQAASQLMQNVSQSLQQAIVKAQQPQSGRQPRLSTAAAFNLRNAVSAAFTPSLLDTVLELQNKSDIEAEAQIDKEMADLAEHKECHEFITEVRSRPRPKPASTHSPSRPASSSARDLLHDLETLGAIRIVRGSLRNSRRSHSRHEQLVEIANFLGTDYRPTFQQNADIFRTAVSQKASQFASHASRQQLDALSILINGASSASATFGSGFDDVPFTADNYFSSQF